MTRTEALLEAYDRYGNGAWVATNEEGRYQVGAVFFRRHFVVYGEHWQGWEQAFANADRKGKTA